MFVQSMKTFGYSLLEESPCLSTGVEVTLNYTRTLFYLEAVRLMPSALVGRRFSLSGENNQDYIQMPAQTIPTAQDVRQIVFKL